MLRNKHNFAISPENEVLPIEGRDGGEGWQHQILGVGVVGVHSGSSLGQGSEMLLSEYFYIRETEEKELELNQYCQ